MKEGTGLGSTVVEAEEHRVDALCGAGIVNSNHSTPRRSNPLEDPDGVLTSDVAENVIPNGMEGQVSDFKVQRQPRRTDVIFDDFSRIEKNPEESLLMSTTKAVHFEPSNIQESEPLRKVMYDFSCTIQSEPYLVSVYKVQDSLFAMFFAVSTGLQRIKRLGSAWKNPPVAEGDSEARLAWYRDNIATVLLNSRGPEVTPRRPPKRAPPQAVPEVSSEAEKSSSSISMDQASKLESDLFVANERIKHLERAAQQHEERHTTEITKLKEDLTSSKTLLMENAERFRHLGDEYEGRLQEWRKRFTESQSEAQISQQEWKQIIAQRDSELDRARLESTAELARMKSRLDEAEAAIASATDAAQQAARKSELSPSKRRRIEDEVWVEAEKVLALARADLKEMTLAKQRAEQFAETKKHEALEAIATCEKVLSLKSSENLVLRHQYDSLVMEKQGLERSLKDSAMRNGSLQEEISQLKIQLEHQKQITDDLVKEFTGMISGGK